MDGEDSTASNPVEDVSKWSVEDVCGFISSLAGCAEYAQVRAQEERGGGEGGQGQANNHRRRVIITSNTWWILKLMSLC